MKIEMATRYSISDALPTGVPLLILHPGYTNQHVLLASAMRQPNKTSVFVSFVSAGSSLQAAWNLLGSALEEQAQLALPAFDSKTNPDKAAQTVLKTLKSIGNFALVIDALDLADAQV